MRRRLRAAAQEPARARGARESDGCLSPRAARDCDSYLCPNASNLLGTPVADAPAAADDAIAVVPGVPITVDELSRALEAAGLAGKVRFVGFDSSGTLLERLNALEVAAKAQGLL